ncbi:MAG: ectoine hydrolase DoeA [Trueperaceae bacterium]
MNDKLNFSRQEYAQRLSKTQRAMSERGINLLIVSDPSNMAWLTGYDGWSFYVHQCVLVPDQGEPLWYGRMHDVTGAKHTVYMNDDRVMGYPDRFVQSSECHPMEYLALIIRDWGWDQLAIGVEMDNYYFSAAAFRALECNLPNGRLLDATCLVNWQRAIKSEQEIEYMRKAARIVERVHQRILEVIEPGMRKNDLVAEIYATTVRGTDEFGGDYPSIVPLLPTGVQACAPHLTWDDAPMERGYGTYFEVAGCYKRYHCPLSRTIFLGKPDERFTHAEGALLEGIEAALEAARPGNTCEEVEAAFARTIACYGIERESRAGYPIGLSYPPDWGERTMSFRPGDKTVLQPGMTFHLMPGLWFDDWGMEITESILIAENGSECLSNVPRRLFVKE